MVGWAAFEKAPTILQQWVCLTSCPFWEKPQMSEQRLLPSVISFTEIKTLHCLSQCNSTLNAGESQFDAPGKLLF